MGLNLIKNGNSGMNLAQMHLNKLEHKNIAVIYLGKYAT